MASPLAENGVGSHHTTSGVSSPHKQGCRDISRLTMYRDYIGLDLPRLWLFIIFTAVNVCNVLWSMNTVIQEI